MTNYINRKDTPNIQIHEKFEIICKNCGSSNIEVTFYAGFIHSEGGDTGSLYLHCNNCQIHLDVEDNS